MAHRSSSLADTLPIPSIAGWRVPRPTLGGVVFWADLYHFRDWRIQQNVRTSRHRLLDRFGFEHASGTYEQCRAAIDDIRERHRLTPWQKDAVLLVHGLFRTRHNMRAMADHLRDHGFDTYSIEYPSTQISIGSHARNLAQIIKDLEGPRTIHIVGHSMGGLIARAYFELGADPRVKRLVTIGTPHLGAEKAAIVQKLGLIRFLGPSCLQLVPGPEGIIHQLSADPTEKCDVEIGVLAAGGKDHNGYSMLLPRDNDGIVTVASNRLPGAKDYILLRGHHSLLPSLLNVRKATTRFLRYGCFRA